LDFILLFTDGMHNMFELPNLKKEVPYYVITSNVKRDNQSISRITKTTNGYLFDILNGYKSDQYSKIFDVIFEQSDSLYFIGYEFDKKELKSVYPKRKMKVSNNVIQCYGRLLETNKDVNLKLLFSKSGVVFEKVIVIEKQIDILEDKNISISWAREYLDHLSKDSEKNITKIMEIGKKFSLVTSQTSLIVLEKLEDYIKHNVEPSKNRKKLYKLFNEYQSIKGQYSKTKDLSNIKRLWSEHVNWFKRSLDQKELKIVEEDEIERKKRLEKREKVMRREMKKEEEERKNKIIKKKIIKPEMIVELENELTNENKEEMEKLEIFSNEEMKEKLKLKRKFKGIFIT
jgi:hypothetical protein